jgi:hypothetical protein
MKLTYKNLLISFVYRILFLELPLSHVLQAMSVAASIAREEGPKAANVYNKEIADLAERLVEETMKSPKMKIRRPR